MHVIVAPPFGPFAPSILALLVLSVAKCCGMVKIGLVVVVVVVVYHVLLWYSCGFPCYPG